MGELSDLCAKPALPVRGLPTVAYLLVWLRHHGVDEVILNLHHRGEDVRRAAREHCPEGLALHFVDEPVLRGTGGGIAGAVEFLRASSPSIIVPGDMVIDFDLTAAIARHQARGARATLLLRDDPRSAQFGTIGTDGDGVIRRIGSAMDLGDEDPARAGVFISVRVLSPEVFDGIPEETVFEDLSDWFAPQLRAGARDLIGERLAPDECVWIPVGTPAEYLAANRAPIPLSYWDSDAAARARGVRFLPGDVVVGARSHIPGSVRLQRAVVWDDEVVPENLDGQDGVFARGTFYSYPA